MRGISPPLTFPQRASRSSLSKARFAAQNSRHAQMASLAHRVASSSIPPSAALLTTLARIATTNQKLLTNADRAQAASFASSPARVASSRRLLQQRASRGSLSKARIAARISRRAQMASSARGVLSFSMDTSARSASELMLVTYVHPKFMSVGDKPAALNLSDLVFGSK